MIALLAAAVILGIGVLAALTRGLPFTMSARIRRAKPPVPVAANPCRHPAAIPVESVYGEIVAHLCPACDEQLDGDWKPPQRDVHHGGANTVVYSGGAGGSGSSATIVGSPGTQEARGRVRKGFSVPGPAILAPKSAPAGDGKLRRGNVVEQENKPPGVPVTAGYCRCGRKMIGTAAWVRLERGLCPHR